MSEHWTPEDDRIGSGPPSVDDDTEGHRKLDEQPGARAAEQPDFRIAENDEDTEGHIRAADKAALRDQDEDDTEGHMRTAYKVPGAQDEDDTEGHRR
jgi:hypothetical protein